MDGSLGVLRYRAPYAANNLDYGHLFKLKFAHTHMQLSQNLHIHYVHLHIHYVHLLLCYVHLSCNFHIHYVHVQTITS